MMIDRCFEDTEKNLCRFEAIIDHFEIIGHFGTIENKKRFVFFCVVVCCHDSFIHDDKEQLKLGTWVQTIILNLSFSYNLDEP